MSARTPAPRAARAALLALVLPSLLAGCTRRTPVREEGSVPFVFRALDLRQQDKQGRPAWELTSPETRYDLRRRVAQALRPRGVIYADGKPIYRLKAESGTVINDGEVILLEGGIRMEQLGRQPVLIRAERVRWIPARQVMEIDRHPEAFDSQGRIVAQRARFLIDRNQLELRGTPQLQRWSQRFDPFKEQPRGKPELVVTVSRADWEPGTGLLEARGPVRGVRRPREAAASAAPQTLTAEKLQGNTVKQNYVLLGPVQIRAPQEGQSFDGRDLRIDAAAQTLASDQPFLGRRGDMQARGTSLRVSGKDHTVEIPAGCLLERPGERLQARRCVWNWTTQAVEAEGSMEFTRQTHRQSIRGHQIKGRLGPGGSLEVINPGGRVVSRFQVPARARPAQPAPPRPKPEPIRL